MWSVTHSFRFGPIQNRPAHLKQALNQNSGHRDEESRYDAFKGQPASFVKQVDDTESQRIPDYELKHHTPRHTTATLTGAERSSDALVQPAVRHDGERRAKREAAGETEASGREGGDERTNGAQSHPARQASFGFGERRLRGLLENQGFSHLNLAHLACLACLVRLHSSFRLG